MKNIGITCFAIILFAIGILVGAELNLLGKEKEYVEENKKIDSIQDLVIEEVQNAQKNKIVNVNEKENEKIQTVTATVTKISPYAILTIEKYFKECGHTTIDSLEIPKELVNMTKEELQAKYEKWEIRNFEERQIHLYREIEANCSSHYVIKEDAGKVAVFSQITPNNMQFKEEVNIDFESLREEDKIFIQNGVEIYGKEELIRFIEDFES